MGIDFKKKGHKKALCGNSEKDWYKTSYSDFCDGRGELYDYEVADYTKRHMRFFDRLNIRKVTSAAMWSFEILSKSTEEPCKGKKNWKFYKDF